MVKYNKILILFFVLVLSACIFNNDDDEPNSYLFIESYTETNGILVSGPEPPALQIDFPTYRYDEEVRTLNGIIDFDINNDLQIIYGSGVCLTGTAGDGCASGLTAVYDIPFLYGSFEILKVEDNGTIRFIYDDDVYSLAVYEERILVTSYLDTTDVDGTNSVSAITSTHTISNYGFISEEDVIPWEW